MELSSPIESALISVSNKSGLEILAGALAQKNVKIFSTGGTADALEKAGFAVTRVEEVTGFPEMMDGRVKTLHPKVFGGVLARRDNPGDLASASAHSIPLFDLVVVNLYPFWDHLGKSVTEQSSQVDIGGPSLLRAASKNHRAVTVLSDPHDYAEFIAEFNPTGTTSLEYRKKQAAKTFARTSHYDAMIASEWSSEKTSFPCSINLVPRQTLRYGENPHQKAEWAGTPTWKLLQGKELSYNNLLDAEAALRIPYEFEEPAVAIIKHGNPCGVASFDGSLLDVYQAALSGDPVSAFGGIVATNREIDEETAKVMAELFLEVVLAPSFSEASLTHFAKKKNLRLLAWPKPSDNPYELRRALGGWLIQDSDRVGQLKEDQIKLVTTTPISNEMRQDLSFAWKVAKHVRSNAIVLAKNGRTLGVGAGQMSRVDSVELALKKASEKNLAGSALASDGFFPFRDNIDRLKGTGVAGVIQPGGSMRDSEVIAACDELKIPMLFTGMRHFRH